MARVHVININTPASSAGFVPVLQQDLDRVRRPDTRLTIDSVEPGLERALDANHAYFNLLNKVSIVERALQAQRDGHQAVVVMCFMDPAVRESREVLDIPVIGVGEASMLYACQLGRRFAVVTLAERKMQIEIERAIVEHGLAARAIDDPVVPIDLVSRDWLKNGLADPGRVADAIRVKAELCAARGAEVVIVGCVGLSPLATLAGLHSVAGGAVPIVDCVQVAMKTAELRAEMNGQPGWPAVSRAGLYAQPGAADMERVRATFHRPASGPSGPSH